MTTPTEKEIAALVKLTESLLKGQIVPIKTDKIMKPFRAQKPRVGLMIWQSYDTQDVTCEKENIRAIELTPAVKLALDEVGIEYDG